MKEQQTHMAIDIEELRREKERLDNERQDIERKLLEAERVQKEEEAASLIAQVHGFTARIDDLKKERHETLMHIRDMAPRIGDFTFAQDDWKLTLHAARQGLKQPELLDKVLEGLSANNLQVEPRNTRFRIVRGLRPAGLLHVTGRRVSLTAAEPIMDSSLIDKALELAEMFPGMVAVELASAKKKRRVKEGVPGRRENGDYATSISFFAIDTGSLDAVLSLALSTLDHVAEYWTRWQPDDEIRLFEPWPDEPMNPPAEAAQPSTAPVEKAAPVEEQAPAVEESAAPVEESPAPVEE